MSHVALDIKTASSGSWITLKKLKTKSSLIFSLHNFKTIFNYLKFETSRVLSLPLGPLSKPVGLVIIIFV